MLKPAGTLSLASGNLSTAAASGGDATGASFAAASLSGRPIKGEPGGSAAGGLAAGGLAGCCAAAPYANRPIKVPASNRLRGDEQIIMTFSPLAEAFVPRAGRQDTCAGGFPGSQSPIFLHWCAIGNMVRRPLTQRESRRSGGVGGSTCRRACRQCLVRGMSGASSSASVNGNSSTISPSSSVTSRIAFNRLPSAASVFSSSRIMARAISQARSASRSSSPSGSAINSSSMRVLKKYRGMGRIHSGLWDESARGCGRNPPGLRDPAGEPGRLTSSLSDNPLGGSNRDPHPASLDHSEPVDPALVWRRPAKKREPFLQCNMENGYLDQRFNWRTFHSRLV